MSNGLEALKRIRQETCPATYIPDFDKNECCDTIERELKALEIIRNVGAIAFYLDKWRIQQVITKEEQDLLKEVLL